MRAKFEGAFHPGGSITFDAANTMDGGYAEATLAAKRTASLHAVTQARDTAEARSLLDMLGLLPARPLEV